MAKYVPDAITLVSCWLATAVVGSEVAVMAAIGSTVALIIRASLAVSLAE